jgi:hypothetical protein
VADTEGAVIAVYTAERMRVWLTVLKSIALFK